ncbi:MAG TPA: hypothetical protein VGE12_18670 [Noviherbaspirillum sp.]
MFVEDLTTFFSTDDFAVEATIDGAAVRGIFDNEHVVAIGGSGMATTSPAFTMATASVPVAPVGKSLVYGGTTYTVAAHQPDGTGVSVLALERTT